MAGQIEKLEKDFKNPHLVFFKHFGILFVNYIRKKSYKQKKSLFCHFVCNIKNIFRALIETFLA